MQVDLLSYTKLAQPSGYPDRASVALTAIRTCYSPLSPSDIIPEEAEKYFGQSARDGEGGTDADRLLRFITKSGHTSTLEHISYTFAITDVSRSLLAQLTRHRVGFSFSVQSQRYVRMGSKDKIQGCTFVVPTSIFKDNEAIEIYEAFLDRAQLVYDALREKGVPPEDARMVLPNATTCNMVMTCNLRALLDFYGKRKRNSGAQWEISRLAEKLRELVEEVDPWLKSHFDEV